MNNTETKRIFLKLERVDESKINLEFDFNRDEDRYVYIMGIASTPDENSAGFIVENKALIDSWVERRDSGKNIAAYEKHDMPIGKLVACEEMNGKVLVILEIPKEGNERFLAVYDQGVYVGLSIGGWQMDYVWDDNVAHVTKFDWYEVSVTDIPSNENALLLEKMQDDRKKELFEKIELENKKQKDILERISLVKNNIIEQIRGI